MRRALALTILPLAGVLGLVLGAVAYLALMTATDSVPLNAGGPSSSVAPLDLRGQRRRSAYPRCCPTAPGKLSGGVGRHVPEALRWCHLGGWLDVAPDR